MASHTVPETQLQLNQRQRSTLKNLIRFEDRPPAISVARWTVMQFGGAGYLMQHELAALADQCPQVIKLLRSVEGEKGAA
jgi:hypothetical protein